MCVRMNGRDGGRSLSYVCRLLNERTKGKIKKAGEKFKKYIAETNERACKTEVQTLTEKYIVHTTLMRFH